VGYLINGLTGIAWGIFISTIISYIMMMAIIRTKIFTSKWKNLILKPYYNGFLLALFGALPCLPVYYGLHFFIRNELIAFPILCTIAGTVGVYLFVRKPALLGSDIAYIQPDLLQMFKRSKGKKQPAAAMPSEGGA
jgi:hypothetical protein